MWIAKPVKSMGREHPLDRHVRLAAGLDLQNHARRPVWPDAFFAPGWKCRLGLVGALVCVGVVLGYVVAQSMVWWGR